ncbi:MAG TPA: rhodanese-like domain-containing protein [Candidatus Binataceae bacterium]|nr:rhodanese-like domain-containing protein [Candidatus Binataceae bacterium]
MALESELAEAPALPPTISQAELKQRLKDPTLTIVDVLPAEAYSTRHIPGAISLPYELIEERARELLPDPNADIAVYCANFT